jgi:hypothetical protein
MRLIGKELIIRYYNQMTTKKQKFTFKTVKSTGRYRSFYSDHHLIKLKRKEVGNIDADKPYKIRLMVIKKDIMEDKNPNCNWKWITLAKNSETLQEAKDFLNTNVDAILAKYEIRSDE